jgi:hypothetical protein
MNAMSTLKTILGERADDADCSRAVEHWATSESRTAQETIAGVAPAFGPDAVVDQRDY